MSCPFAHASLPLARPPGADASTDEVVAWLLGTGHLSLIDEEGRPLGERASPLYDQAPTDEQHRAFGDLRDESGLPCNVAALGQLRRAWPRLLEALGSFESERPSTHRRLLRRAEAASALAPLLALRADGGPPNRDAVALFKVTLGFREVFGTALMEGRVDADAAPDGRELLPWLDRRGFLIGDAQVCAGSRAQIRRAFDALCESRPPAPSDRSPAWSAPWFEGALDALSELHALAGAGAGAARMLVARGALSGAEDAASYRLYTKEQVPRWAEALRQIPDAGPLQVSLLSSAAAVPSSLRGFLDSLVERSEAASLEAVDAALEREARPVAARLMSSLGRGSAAPLTRGAFASACS